MSETSPPLTAEEAATLVDFARACKAAARAVLLYPAGHPAITTTLGRIVQLTSADALQSPLRLTVLPDGLLLGDRAPARPDPAIGELAVLLHTHLIGELTVRAGGDESAWRAFLMLLGRAPDAIRADGGIGRLWAASGQRHVEVREIDYAEVLRERSAGESAAWQHVVASCLQGDAFNLDDEEFRELLDVIGDTDRLTSLMAAVETAAGAAGTVGASTAALLRLLRGIVDAVSSREPDRLEATLRTMAAALGRLSPGTLIDLLKQRGARGDHRDVVSAVVNRMSDATIAEFVATDVCAEGSATERLAMAFQALVPDPDRQQRLLSLAREDVAASPLGRAEGFEPKWNQIAEQLLTSYSDQAYVTGAYARELSGARTHAVDVERVSDDPPERVNGWLTTITTTAVRTLDRTLLLDLLRIEQNPDRWGALMLPVVRLLEDLLLVGDFEAAHELIDVVARDAHGPADGRRPHAARALQMLVDGPTPRHLTTHLASADEAHFELIKTLCGTLGEGLVRPLAEALSTEDHARSRERLTAILLAFGSVGRPTIERLKSSQNPAVRRTAIYLMRELGGSEALPDLTDLVDDNEPQVQRAAIRAILDIGTNQAFQILERALTTGTARARDAIMQSIGAVRDERATPLFVYILRHVDHRGPLASIYVRTIEALGALRDPAAIGPLEEALHKGDWWAPRRTAALRSAAAGALARIGTPDAIAALERAAAGGSRSVRTAARTQLASARRRSAARGGAG